jgi:S1-C subfamily serine protease
MDRIVITGGTTMETCSKRLRRVVKGFGTGIFLALLGAAIAWADADSDRTTLFAKVMPAIVHIRHDQSLDGGFVADAGRGIVATNYHVIEGAKKVTIFFPCDGEKRETTDAESLLDSFFPGDGEKREFPADGYLAILPGKDLALVHVNFANKKVASLKLADKNPQQGDAVYTFGLRMMRDYSIADGIVSAVRTGQEVSDLMDRFIARTYVETAGYDLDATWIEHTAPISPGSCGGPLVGRDGQVVGLNTMMFASATGRPPLNFAISAKHLRDLLAKAGKEVKPWSTLPPSRHKTTPADGGDPAKTLAAWIEYLKAKCVLKDVVRTAEKELIEVGPRDDEGSEADLNSWSKKKAALFSELGKALAKYVARIKTSDVKLVDPQLVELLKEETEVSRRLGDAYRESAAGLLAKPSKAVDESKLSTLRSSGYRLDGIARYLGVAFCGKYGRKFPTLEETARQMNEGGKRNKKGEEDN